MSKKNIKCPHCHKKTPFDNPICINCKRLIESSIKEEKKKKRFFPLVLIILVAIGIILYFNKDNTNSMLKLKRENIIKDFNSSVKNIKYDNSYKEDKLIYTRYNNSNILINKTGKIIEKNISNLVENFNNFIILSKKEGNKTINYIIDNKGKILYQDDDRIIYYPKTNTFLIGNKLYYNKILVADNIVIDENIDYEGYYFSYNKDNEGGIIDYKGNIVYKTTIENFLYLESSSINEDLDNNYCLINKDYKYGIINCKTGKVIIDYSTNIIKELNNNIFEINDNIFYLTNNEDKMYYQKDYDEVNFKSIYYGNNNLLLGKKLINTKTNSSSNNYILSNTNIEKDNNINRIICQNIKIYYGINKNNDSIIPCEYDNILFFNDNINNYLKNKDKIYTILIKNGKTSIYNISNKKIIEDVQAISLSSPIIIYREDNIYYAYNLYNDTFLIIPNYSKASIHDNALELDIINDKNKTTDEKLYDLDFNEIKISE